MKVNRQVLLESRPVGTPVEQNFRVIENPIRQIADGEVLIQNLYISLDAGFRNWMKEGSGDHILPAMEIGEPVMGLTLGRVVESKNPKLPLGDLLMIRVSWEEYSISNGIDEWYVKLPEGIDAPLSYYLGILGDTGLSAYFGLTDVGKLQLGETLLVSGAGGAVGSVAGQIGKIFGARSVGIAGSDQKCQRLMDELGYDAAVNYRDTEDLSAAIGEACPNGVDVYFDNTGGMILGSALFRMNVAGRIACCGVVSQYDTDTPEPGPKGVPGLLVNKRITMQGFLLFDYEARYAEARNEIYAWLTSGKMTSLQDEVSGLAAAPEAFVDLLSGGNVGTRIVRLDQ